MPLKNAKAKGNAFERKVATMMTDAFGEPFTRVPQSGGFVGGKNAARKANLDDRQIAIHKGDIIPPESFANLVIECKHRKEFNSAPLHRLLAGSWSPLNEALSQVINDCDKNDIPMVFFQGSPAPVTLLAVAARALNTVPEINYIPYNVPIEGGWTAHWGICDANELLNDKDFKLHIHIAIEQLNAGTIND